MLNLQNGQNVLDIFCGIGRNDFVFEEVSNRTPEVSENEDGGGGGGLFDLGVGLE